MKISYIQLDTGPPVSISFEIRALLNGTLFNVPSSPTPVPYMPPIKQCFDIDYNSFSVLLLLFPWQPDHTRPPKLLGKVPLHRFSSASLLLSCFQSHLDMSEMERSPNLRAAIWKCILNYVFYRWNIWFYTLKQRCLTPFWYFASVERVKMTMYVKSDMKLIIFPPKMLLNCREKGSRLFSGL